MAQKYQVNDHSSSSNVVYLWCFTREQFRQLTFVVDVNGIQIVSIVQSQECLRMTLALEYSKYIQKIFKIDFPHLCRLNSLKQ